MNIMGGFPNLPDLPEGAGGILPAGIDALIDFGAAFAIGLLFGNRWGIFNQYGIPVLLADNVTSVEYQNSANVLSAPVEKGTFASYNKVQEPFTAVVQMTKGGGDVTMRGLFITQLEALSKTTLLFNVLTPEYVHRNAAIVGFGYKRSAADGNRLIVANIELKEVREVAVKYETEEVENPEDLPPEERGNVEAEEPDRSILSRASETIGNTMTDLFNRGKSAVEQAIGVTP